MGLFAPKSTLSPYLTNSQNLLIVRIQVYPKFPIKMKYSCPIRTGIPPASRSSTCTVYFLRSPHGCAPPFRSATGDGDTTNHVREYL